LKKSNFDYDLRIKYDTLKMSSATILLLRIKHLYVRILFKLVPAVAIGEICQDVFEANHFRISSRIPNRVQACNHDANIFREPGTVLFAGRLIEKGLEETALGVMQAGMRLILIGPPELYQQAIQFCPAEKVEYLGNKSNQELLLLLHKFEIVSICSQSFDNYPTIGLEAIVHGCKVVTTEVTGLSRLLARYGVQATIQVGQIPDFHEIQKIPNSQFQNYELLREITNPAITVESYLDLFRSSQNK
jgi:glycosyltransferase involved in cell wall biosynthesis